ncbi:hypothetical protein [Aeromicrobium chenweiae]|uniref:Uncharacterized protein n=1 Tax=Aeromicrobium chenweiae TaxID=2079793 RepID=A0A2S0WKR9_9ACTN|nr:hypothetical protein [Aeromicrobium chenweiae]AWB91935.1 hypothetical protein C3E78_06840 [Aeromicrobium chenweiae]TGN32786.1 hypothetical protein E4L97_08810 [Aeromicrobium chenweiae]
MDLIWTIIMAILDKDRAAAFADADATRLDDVYVEGSRARAADAATIRSYARRDGRVLGAELRVLTCRVVRAGSDRATLDVVDVLSPSRVEWGDGTTTELPRDQPSRHRVTLHRTADGWRIAGSWLR